MTSSMTSQGGLKVGPLYSFMNEITKLFMITKQRAKITSLNFLCICNMRLWLQLYKIYIHDVIDDVTGAQNRSILKLIYLRQYLSYSVDQKLKMSDMLMAIFLVYSTSGITSGKKSLSRAQNGGHFENFEILDTASIWLQIWKDRPKLCQKSIFMMMTSSMTSQGGIKIRPLYSFIYEITTFFMIIKKRAKISSLNFLCICIMRLWLQLYKYIFMTSLMTSPGHKIGQFWNWYISVNIWVTASIKSSKCRICSWLSFWYIQLPV